MPESKKKKKTIIAFDLYGTLLSTDSIATELALYVGEDKAPAVAALWRRYQLEYTWRANSMGTYAPFDAISRASLLHAAAECGPAVAETLTPTAVADSLMRAYNRLRAFPDAVAGLDMLRAVVASDLQQGGPTKTIEPYVFTNGTLGMVRASLSSSHLGEGAAAAGVLFAFPGDEHEQRIVSVDEVRVFKPHPEAYRHFLRSAGVAGEGDVWLVSGNPFDVVGAVAAGWKAAWVDRAGTGWVDRLGGLVYSSSGPAGSAEEGEGVAPTVVVSGVKEAVEEIIRRRDIE